MQHTPPDALPREPSRRSLLAPLPPSMRVTGHRPCCRFPPNSAAARSWTAVSSIAPGSSRPASTLATGRALHDGHLIPPLAGPASPPASSGPSAVNAVDPRRLDPMADPSSIRERQGCIL